MFILTQDENYPLRPMAILGIFTSAEKAMEEFPGDWRVSHMTFDYYYLNKNGVDYTLEKIEVDTLLST